LATTEEQAYCAECSKPWPCGVHQATRLEPGLSAEDFAAMLDDARSRRVKSFVLKTTMRGCPVELSAVFETEPRGRQEGPTDG
jgi:hypothetical protein